MKIRKCLLSDIPELIELYRDLVPWKLSEGPSADLYREMQEDDNYAVMVAEDEEGRLVGTAMGVCCKSLAGGGKNFLVIEDVIVKEAARKTGVGKRLLSSLDEYALCHNCSYAILVSSGFRKGAHAFYERMGFTEDVRGFRKGYEE